MKLASFSIKDRASYGIVKDGKIIDAGGRWSNTYPSFDAVLAEGALGAIAKLAEKCPADYALKDVRLMRPLPQQAKIICVGINYFSHDEMEGVAERPKYPTLFLRMPSSLVAHEEHLLRPPESPQLDYEGEIALLIGKRGRRVAESEALSHVAGYTICNEATVRDWQRHAKGSNTPGKNFERSGAIGPWLVTPDEMPQAPLRVTTRVNGETRQNDTTDHMLYPIPYLISYISHFCTLEPGDVISTGTPPGTGWSLKPARYLVPGDVVEVEVPGVGTLRNAVADE